MSKATVLLVDDTPANLKALAGMLRNSYRIIIAKSGEEALQLIYKGDIPDLVLLDIMMPGMDGYEVCSKLKANPDVGDVPVIFITAKTDEEGKQKGLSLGAAAYITKPFDADAVLQIVEESI